MVRRSDGSRREDAAQWAVRLSDEQDSVDPAELDQLQHFLRDGRNAEEFVAMSRILLMLDCLRDRDRERLSVWADAHKETRAHWRLKRCAIAASFLVVLLIGGDSNYVGRWYRDVITAGAGETRGVRLHSGGIAILKSGGQLRKVDDDKECRYEVMRGEVEFEFAPDALRPCRVLIGGTEVRVLGTRFSVRRDADEHVVVRVLQGVVEVRSSGRADAPADWSQILRANEQLQYQLPGLNRAPQGVQANAADRPRNGLYQFENESLENVVAELSRHTSVPILIRDPRAAEERVGGALSITDVERSIRTLENYARITVRKQGGVLMIDYRPEVGQNKN